MNKRKNTVRQDMKPFFFMKSVKNENTKAADPHAQSARSFMRNTAVMLFPPNRETIATHRTSHAKENASAFLKYMRYVFAFSIFYPSSPMSFLSAAAYLLEMTIISPFSSVARMLRVTSGLKLFIFSRLTMTDFEQRKKVFSSSMLSSS